jgi:hypothetical protein
MTGEEHVLEDIALIKRAYKTANTEDRKQFLLILAVRAKIGEELFHQQIVNAAEDAKQFILSIHAEENPNLN